MNPRSGSNSIRITKELLSIKQDENLNFDVHLPDPDDVSHWIIVINSSIHSTLESEAIILDCKFPQYYPFQPPMIK